MSDSPQVLAPAPWELLARAYVLVLRLDQEQLDTQCFVPETLRGLRETRLSYAMFVDYTESPVGPYQELLFIPGAYRIEGKRFWTISKIYVSTQASVDNGRRNWGIPKELARFEVSYGADRVDHVRMHVGDDLAAEIEMTHRALKIPLIGAVFPSRIRTLCQTLDDRRFTLAPSASGTLQSAKVSSIRTDPRFFPAIRPESVTLAVGMPRLRMCFPQAQIDTLP